MRRHGSVLLLAVRGITGKLLVLLAALAAVETLLFFLTLPEQSLELILENSHISMAFRAALLALAAICCLQGSGLRGGRARYTLRRLSVGEPAILFWWSGCYAAAFLILMGFQLLLLLGFCGYYLAHADPAQISAQTVFLAAHRDSFFHSLLPLEEGAVYVRNGLFAVTLGITCATWSFWRRRDTAAIAVYGVAFLVAVFFPTATGNWSACLFEGVLAVLAAGISIFYVWQEVRHGKN